MPDWLRQSFVTPPVESWETLVVRLISSLLLGSVIAVIHRITRGRMADHTATFPATLVMLSVLIAMVTQVIGDNVARAFSLVGALSIVRFRTVVRDTKDTAFVIFAVVVGMAVGAGQPAVALIGLATVAAAAAIHRDRPHEATGSHIHRILAVKLIWSRELETLLRETLAKHTRDVRPLSASTIRQGSAMELSFLVKMNPSAALSQLVSEINRLEGVISADLTPEPRES